MTFVSSEGGLWQVGPVKLTFAVALNSFKQIEHMRPGLQGNHLVTPWGMLAHSFPPPRREKQIAEVFTSCVLKFNLHIDSVISQEVLNGKAHAVP